MLPVVSIVGRPNVGKSSLLNAFLRKRFAIVDDMAGVTRDRVAAPVRLDDKWVEMVDTGGIGIVDTQQLEEHVEAQIEQAIAVADALVIFVADGRDGLHADRRGDRARVLRATADVPMILAVNKVESRESQAEQAVERVRQARPRTASRSRRSRRHRHHGVSRRCTFCELLAGAWRGRAPARTIRRLPALKVAILGSRQHREVHVPEPPRRRGACDRLRGCRARPATRSTCSSRRTAAAILVTDTAGHQARGRSVHGLGRVLRPAARRARR